MPAAAANDHAPTQDLLSQELMWLARILHVVRERKGVDFSGYRQATLLRRVRNRMIAANALAFPNYFERLLAEPREVDALLAKLTIKVSRFFRDEATFDVLRRAIEARRAAGVNSRLRCWSAGCGQGEEAYSLAMLLDQLSLAETAEVLATDIDTQALNRALKGRYTSAAVKALPAEMRDRYFDGPASDTSEVTVRSVLRTMVDFQFHDLTSPSGPAHTSRFELICCRNVLIYFESWLQERVQWQIWRCLVPSGLLCLGEAEWLLPPLSSSFDVVDRKARVFRKRATGANL